MTASNSTLTQDELKKFLHYNPNTGVFTWLVDRYSNKIKGTVAGCIQTMENGKKYRYIRIKSNPYRANRLALLYVNGVMPTFHVDHISGDSLDDSFENLRDVTCAVNNKNKTRHKNNTSGTCGVGWNRHREKWMAYIRVNKKLINLGYFVSLIDAVIARKMAEYSFDFHFNHGQEKIL